MIIKSYLKSGIRSFLKDKVSSSINIIGLASTISIAIAVYLTVDMQLHLDQFHADHQRIYLVQSRINWDRSTQTWARSPQLLGRTIKDEMPQVESMTRVQVKPALIRYDDKVFAERLSFSDPEFFDVFDFELKAGNMSSLSGRNNMIIGEKEAKKYFRDEDPLGKELRVIVDERVYLFTIAGIAEDFPKTASFGFNFLLSIENLPTMFDVDLNSWSDINRSSLFTFIKLDHPGSLPVVKKRVSEYLDIINEINPDWPILDFQYEPLTTTARKSQFTVDCLPCGSTPQVIIMFAVISLILFASACFNYINISIALSSKRLKEIALRKVVGSTRNRIIQQFMFENLVFSFIAVILGVILAYGLIIPGMNVLFGGDSIELNFIENTRLILFMVILFIVVGISSGAYPAYYISSFKPLDIFRGREEISGKNNATKIFLTLQFFITFIALVAGLIFTETNRTQKEQDWGYDPNDIFVVQVENDTQYKVMEQFAAESGEVLNYCGSRNQLGRSRVKEAVEVENEKVSVDAFYVDAGYLKTMNLDLIKGSFFNPGLQGINQNFIVINETMLRKFGWDIDNYDQARIKISDTPFQVIGVVRDFHYFNFFEPIGASIFRMVPENNYRYLSMKAREGEVRKIKADAKSLWLANFPDVPFTSFYQKNVFDTFFQQTGQLISIMNFTSIMAILLSCMGLFGLVSLLIIKRMKELSIRNVLGASQWDSIALISRQFIWVLGIALILALPTSYFLFSEMLKAMFLGSSSLLSPTPFIIALLIIGFTILLTVFYHMRNLMRANPIDYLRME